MSWEKIEKDVTKSPFGVMKWTFILLMILTLFFGAIGYCARFSDVVMDRVILKNSFQYKEGMAQRGAILEANILELEQLMIQQPENRAQLKAQKRILKAQLRAITINQ